MNLAIVYHLHKNFLNLSKSIDSLFSQDNMDFELILVNDFYIDEVKDILKKYDFSKFKNVKFLNFNANLGHAISFNKSLQLTKSKFIFYMGSNVVLQNNFVSIICSTIKQSDGADIISFLNKKDDSKEKLLSFSSLTEQEYKLVKYGIKDKIFNTNFLKSKKIILNEQKYMPLLFLYEIISSFTKWVVINDYLCEFTTNNSYTYNLYNIFNQNDILISNYSATEFWDQHYFFIEYLMLFYTIKLFLPRILFLYKDRKPRKLALDMAKQWINANIPNWQSNSLIVNNTLKLSNIDLEYFKNFKFKVKYILKFNSLVK